jgi:peroxiredoxin
MKINISLLVLSFFMLAFTPVKDKLPAIDVKTLDGESINIQEFGENGKITVISFWATWCLPCKKELDAIADMYPEWQEDYDMELVAITIDNARGLSKVRPMVEEKGWEFEILSDAGEDLKRALNFQTVPQTFLLNQSGEIVYAHSGYAPGDEFELEDKIKKLAGK